MTTTKVALCPNCHCELQLHRTENGKTEFYFACRRCGHTTPPQATVLDAANAIAWTPLQAACVPSGEAHP